MSDKKIESPSVGSYASLRAITPEDVITEANRNYQLGRKHGKGEMMDDIIRARAIALRLVSEAGKPEIEEAFGRLLGSSGAQRITDEA